MKKIIASLIALVLTVVQIGSASAKPNSPDCRVHASKVNVVVGEKIQFSVDTTVTGPVFWDFANGVISTETSPEYAFPAVNDDYVVMASIRNSRYGNISCTIQINVKNDASSDQDNGYGGGMNFPEEIPSTPTPVIAPVSSITTGNISADLNEMGENTGENSFGVVNTGDGDVTVTIERAPEPVATQIWTPTPIAPVTIPDQNCSDNLNNTGTVICAATGSTIIINQSEPEQKVDNWLQAFIHAFLKGNETFFKVLDESMFPVVPVTN